MVAGSACWLRRHWSADRASANRACRRSPSRRRARSAARLPRRRRACASRRRAFEQPATPSTAEAPQLGALPIVTDQFATVTVVPTEELRRTPARTLGDLLFSKPGITGSSFAPGAASPADRARPRRQPRPHPGERHRRERRVRSRRRSLRADRSAGDATRSR